MNGRLTLKICGKRYHTEQSIKNFHKELNNYQKCMSTALRYGQVIKRLTYLHFIESCKKIVSNSAPMS